MIFFILEWQRKMPARLTHWQCSPWLLGSNSPRCHSRNTYPKRQAIAPWSPWSWARPRRLLISTNHRANGPMCERLFSRNSTSGYIVSDGYFNKIRAWRNMIYTNGTKRNYKRPRKKGMHHLKLTNTENSRVYRPAMDGANPHHGMSNMKISYAWRLSQPLQNINNVLKF